MSASRDMTIERTTTLQSFSRYGFSSNSSGDLCLGDVRRSLRRLRKTGKVDDRLAHEPRRLERILAETRRRGYATRDTGYVGGFYGALPQDDGLAAIAVPILDGTRVHGSINILWIKTAFATEEFATWQPKMIGFCACLYSREAARSPRAPHAVQDGCGGLRHGIVPITLAGRSIEPTEPIVSVHETGVRPGLRAPACAEFRNKVGLGIRVAP